MSSEELIKTELVKRFGALEGKIRIPRPRRVFAEVDMSRFEEVFSYAIANLGFTMLCTITGLDDGATFGLIYHLAREDGTTLNIRTSIPKDVPRLKTMTAYYPTAEIYERELVDLFGIEVAGLPEGPRYPLPDDWPKGEYPLRKDWKPKPRDTMEDPKDA